METTPKVRTEDEAVKFWEDAIRKGIEAAIERIVEEEGRAASERVLNRVVAEKGLILQGVTERLRIMQRFSPGEIRFEIVIQG